MLAEVALFTSTLPLWKSKRWWQGGTFVQSLSQQPHVHRRMIAFDIWCTIPPVDPMYASFMPPNFPLLHARCSLWVAKSRSIQHLASKKKFMSGALALLARALCGELPIGSLGYPSPASGGPRALRAVHHILPDSEGVAPPARDHRRTPRLPLPSGVFPSAPPKPPIP